MGLYFGEYLRTLGDVHVTSSLAKTAYGIQVLTGMEYLIRDFVSVRGELRFRDPVLEFHNSYSNNIIHYNGQTYRINGSDFDTKININGVTFSLGIVYNIKF